MSIAETQVKKRLSPRYYGAPLCRDCIHKLHVPFTAGYCRRWFWVEHGVPQYGRCVDMRTERCGLKNPRFFVAKGASA